MLCAVQNTLLVLEREKRGLEKSTRPEIGRTNSPKILTVVDGQLVLAYDVCVTLCRYELA